MTDNKDLVVIEAAAPAVQMRLATDVAGVSREIVLKTARNIQGRKYVQVEGWMAIATAHGCALSAEDVRSVDGGIAARGVVKRIRDGAIITTAEGFVGDDERMWAGRPMFARRAMAQTRAMSRAARSAFAHVVVMIDSGLSTTPAEEMEGVEAETPAKPEKPAPKATKPAEAKPAPAPAPLPVTTCPSCGGGKNPTQMTCSACERKEEEAARAKATKPSTEGASAREAKSAATTAAEIKEARALFVSMGVKTTDELKANLTSILGYEVTGSLTALSNEERGKVLAELRKHATPAEKAGAVNG